MEREQCCVFVKMNIKAHFSFDLTLNDGCWCIATRVNIGWVYITRRTNNSRYGRTQAYFKSIRKLWRWASETNIKMCAINWNVLDLRVKCKTNFNQHQQFKISIHLYDWKHAVLIIILFPNSEKSVRWVWKFGNSKRAKWDSLQWKFQ